MKINVYPLDRIEVDGVSISFGMEQVAVEKALGKGEVFGKRNYYFDGEMAIDYDSNSRVDFIEFLGGFPGSLRPCIYSVSAFDTLADELVQLLSKMNNGEADDIDNGYTLTFQNISIGLYREARPQDVLEMIEEMKADGIPTDGNEDVAEEEQKANHWATLGVGSADYYRR